jgi:hypothetical protein
MSFLPLVAPLLQLVSLVAGSASVSADCRQAAPPADRPTARVLFVGNSFTFGSDLPCLVAELGLSLDQPVRFQTGMVARDGATLESHWRGGEIVRRLREERWDVLVLQEQSSRSITDPSLMETYVRRFAAVARSAGTDVVLYETWARVDEPETEKPRSESYQRIAAAVGARVAPVGTAWRLARAALPDLRLHAEDGLHAGPAGSYLAACVILAVLTGRSPVGVAAPVANPDSARALQELAWQAISGPGAPTP